MHRRTGQVNTDRKRKKKLTHEKKIRVQLLFCWLLASKTLTDQC